MAPYSMRAVSAFAVTLLFASVPLLDAPALAADCGGAIRCACGDRAVDNTTLLPTDPVIALGPCPNDGLIVEPILVSSLTLDLGGNTITGTNKGGIGLLVVLGPITVINGGVRNFDVGIKGFFVDALFLGSDTTSLSITQNRTGIDLVVQDLDVIRTAVVANLGDGMRIQEAPTGLNRFVRNTCSRNGGRGIFLDKNIPGAGGAATEMVNNRCELNGSHGIEVRGHNYTLTRNLGGRNGGTGILVVGDGNTLHHNQGRTNSGDGVRAIGTGLQTDERNYGEGNGGTNCLIDGSTPTGSGGRWC